MAPKPPEKSDKSTKGRQEIQEHWPINGNALDPQHETDEEESAVAAPTFPVEQKCDNHASKVLADAVPYVATKSEVDGHVDDKLVKLAAKSEADRHAHGRQVDIAVKGKVDGHPKAEEKEKGNAAFQHYYAKHEACAKNLKDGRVKCETCTKVLLSLNHIKFCEINVLCRDCQLVDDIKIYHKERCPIGEAAGCLFCGANADQNVYYSDGTIVDEITQIKETPLKNTKFVENADYEFGVLLGKGGNGTVYSVKLLEPGQAKLGIKDKNCLAAKLTNARLDNEVDVLRTIKNNNVSNVVVHYFIVNKRGTASKEPDNIIFMQRAEMSLKDYKKKRSGSVLPLKEAFIYFRQIVETMVHIHHLHITHNDIKPENVLMFPDTGKASYSPHLCDFEYAIREGCPGRHGGTKLFMPPEGDDGPHRDVYALGILFLELTIPETYYMHLRCRRPRSEAERVNELKNKLHGREMGKLIETCLEEKEKRPTIDELLNNLNEIGNIEEWMFSDVLGP